MSLRGRGRRRRGHALNAEVNIINLVDVMLVLLIIFMVTAPILQSGISVRLPKSSTRSSSHSESMTVTVLADGGVAVGDTRESLSEFEATFATVVKTKNPDGINVRSDGAARMQDVVRVFDEIRRSGIQKINLMTEIVNR